MRERQKPIFFSLVFLLLLSPHFAKAQDISRMILKSKQSINGLEASNAERVNISIRLMGADKLGLTEENVKTRCTSLLEKAGIEAVYSLSQFESLHISIHLVGDAMTIRLQFLRAVIFPVISKGKETPYFMLAPTWEILGTGTHGGDPKQILESLIGQLDLFISEYRKANGR